MKKILNNSLTYSLSALVLSIICFALLLSDSYFDLIDKISSFKRIDAFIFDLSNYRWSSFFSDLIFNLFIGLLYLPYILIPISVFFGFKSLNSKNIVSKKVRILSLIVTTISVCILLTLLVGFFLM